MKFRNDAEVAVQVLHENGGFSLTRDLNAAQGQAYFAAYSGYEEQTPLEKFGVDTLLAFRQRNFHLLAESAQNLIGGWLHEGVVYLDLSRAFDRLDNALDFAKAHNQIAIWDGFNSKEIMVPEQHAASSAGLLIAKLKAMFTHPIFAPGLAQDDATNPEGEDDDLTGWSGLLTGDLFQPAFASVARDAPPGAPSRLPIRYGDWGTFDFSLPDNDSGEDRVYKWVWNEKEGVLLWFTDAEGMPVHDQVMLEQWHRKPIEGQDFRGYAIPFPDHIEMESFKHDCPLKAFQDVKAQIAKVEGDKPIELPSWVTDQQQFGVEIVSPPKEARDHSLAAQWAQAALGDAPLKQGNLFYMVARKQTFGSFSALGFQLKEAQADKSGCMVALYVPTKVAENIAIKGGEPVEDLHITLAYFEEKGADRDDWDRAIEIAKGVALSHKPLKGKITGVGVFHMDGDEGDVLWASPSIPGLAEFRTDLVDALNRGGFRISDTYGYNPHITLKYEFTGKPPRMDGGYELDFDSAYFVVARERTKLPFA